MTAKTMSSVTHYKKQRVSALLAFFVVSVLTALPILLHPFLPLVDLPNHIARHYISTMPPGPLTAYYDYDISLVPNSAVDLAWLMLGESMDAVRFSQLAIAFYCVSFVASLMILSRVLHGHWSAWPAVGALFCYNSNFFWGFQNYIVSVPFAIFALALWFWTERLQTTRRILILTPFILLLYVMHFFAFAFLAFAVFGREIQRILEAGQKWRTQLLQALLLATPFILPIVWLIFDVITGPPNPAGTFSEFGAPYRRLEVLQSTVGSSSQILPPAILLTGTAILVVLALSIWAVFSPSLSVRLKVAPQMRGPLIVLCAVAVVMPFSLNGVAYLHIRFPFVIAALLFAATRWQDMPVRQLRAIAFVIVALFVARGIAFDRYAAVHSNEVRDFVTITQSVPAGDRLLPVIREIDPQEVRLWHITAYAVPYHNVFVPTLFRGVHSLTLKPEWHDYATPAYHASPLSLLLTDWDTTPIIPLYEFIRNWDQKYTHLIYFGGEASELAQLSALREISRRGRFTLYEIVGDQGRNTN